MTGLSGMRSPPIRRGSFTCRARQPLWVTLTVTGGAFVNCWARLGGGAILNTGTASISQATSFASDNAWSGGGIQNLGSAAKLTASNLVISNCAASGPGGGIFNSGGTALVSGTTIMQCQAQRGILEFSYRWPGRYMFHAHQSEFAELGWMGMFNVVDAANFGAALSEVGLDASWDEKSLRGSTAGSA